MPTIVRLTGPRSEVETLLSALAADTELDVQAPITRRDHFTGGRRLEQTDMVEVLVHFGVSLSAHLAADYLLRRIGDHAARSRTPNVAAEIEAAAAPSSDPNAERLE